ncbi:MAG TPA: TDP-N-acetylfucosamine:lipid II N-acetylfucosaminyltransferase [Longimicrobiales bacterium]
MRLLHFVTDEKFIPFAQQVYEEAFPGSNEYRVDADPSRPSRYVTPGPDLVVKGREYWSGAEVRRDFERFDCVVAHYMTPRFVQAIAQAPSRVMVVWSGWGADYYPLLEPITGPLVLPATARLARRAMPLRMRAIVALRRRLPRRHTVRSIARRLDVVSVNPAEVDMFRRALPECDAVHHHLPYYSTEATFEPGPAAMNGPDILLGNSASPENNHVEALEALARTDLGTRRVIVPLSYGDAGYADAVTALGRALLGDRFVALRSFMSLDEYHDAIGSCGVVLMNHVRQQAVGTISTALYKGAVVILRRENPVTRFYADMGVQLRADAGASSYDAQLSDIGDAARARNRAIVGDFWRHERVVRCIRGLAELRGKRAAQRAGGGAERAGVR